MFQSVSKSGTLSLSRSPDLLLFEMKLVGHAITLFSDLRKAVWVQWSMVGICRTSVVIQMSVHHVCTDCTCKEILFGITYQYRHGIACTAGLPQSTVPKQFSFILENKF